MKSPSHPSAKRQAKPQLGTLSDHCEDWYRVQVNDKSAPFDGPRAIDSPNPAQHFLVLPVPSLKQARARKRFEEMREREQVKLLAAQLFHPLADYDRAKDPEKIRREQIRAVLRVLKGET